LVLWTTDVQATARRIYQRAGFELTAEEPHPGYGAGPLMAQDWRLVLTAHPPGKTTSLHE
jgi:hypothetical protein